MYSTYIYIYIYCELPIGEWRDDEALFATQVFEAVVKIDIANGDHARIFFIEPIKTCLRVCICMSMYVLVYICMSTYVHV